MQYISTRGLAPPLQFDDVLLEGLASDGGLYVPNKWPQLSESEFAKLKNLSYPDMALEIMYPYIGDVIPREILKDILFESYANFSNSQIAPIKRIDDSTWLLELFHGPTLAFKDYALQVVGKLFNYVLEKKKKTVTIIGATSGDTGSAAIEACKNKDAINLFMMHPKGRVSEVQRRQMTTVESSNIYNIAIEGTFDDCQDMVKLLFSDQEMREKYNLSAVNSINWARILSQIVYYFWAGISLHSSNKKLKFIVPTGNFGNIFAGYAAHKMGLPIHKLLVASNENNILTRYLNTGNMTALDVKSTSAPSMDIQISSNFERLIFDVYNQNGTNVREAMNAFRKTNSIRFSEESWEIICNLFDGFSASDQLIRETILRFYETKGELIDPHTATGIAASLVNENNTDTNTVCLATAHPAKFPNAIKDSVGFSPEVPKQLKRIFQKEEKFTVLPNDFGEVKNFIYKNNNR